MQSMSPILLPEGPSYYYYPPIYAWVFQVVSFLHVSPQKSCMYCSSPPYVLHAPTHLILLDLITRIIGEKYRRSLSSSLCSFLHSPCYAVPVRPKYYPQHSILKHPPPTFLPQFERPSFTPTQNNRLNYRSVYLNLYCFIAKINIFARINLRHATQMTVMHFLQVNCNLCAAMNLSVGPIFVFTPQHTHIYWPCIIHIYIHKTHTHAVYKDVAVTILLIGGFHCRSGLLGMRKISCLYQELSPVWCLRD